MFLWFTAPEKRRDRNTRSLHADFHWVFSLVFTSSCSVSLRYNIFVRLTLNSVQQLEATYRSYTQRDIVSQSTCRRSPARSASQHLRNISPKLTLDVTHASLYCLCVLQSGPAESCVDCWSSDRAGLEVCGPLLICGMEKRNEAHYAACKDHHITSLGSSML